MMKKQRMFIVLLMGFAMLFSGGTIVLAQDDASTDEVMLEEIVVTGSRIARQGFSSSSPLAVFDEQDITLSGNSSVDEFLKYVPQFTGYQMGKSTNNGSDQGQTKIDVRGLGFNRTLVLVNGRRTIGDATYDGAVDINTIPEAMIKRVDVLTDGASSIYGSDAIAGVVNFVLDDEFEGVRITTDYGAGTQEWDAENYGISMLAGAGNDRGHIVFSMSWSKQKELLQGERDWAADSFYPLLEPDGTFKLYGTGSSNSRTIRVDSGDAAGSWIYDTALGTARPYSATTDSYNYSLVNALTQPNERYQFATMGKYEIAENTEAYFEGMYTRRTSHQRLAPDASFNAADVETPNNGTQNNDFVPANNPYNPFGSVACSNDADVCGIDVRVNRRFVESGGRIFSQKADQYRMVWGVRGELEDMFKWDVAYTWAETQTLDETLNYGRFDHWATAVDPVACAADADCAAAGVLNPFGDYGTITPAQMAYLTTGSLKDLYNSSLKMVELNLTGELSELDGGNIGWAAGYMHRRESGTYSPDEFIASGLTTGGASDPLEGAFTADEVYGEMLFPVLDVLSFDASFRWSDYDSVDSSKTTWKLGADWEAFDGFRLRGTIGTGFRAPNIAELNDTGSTTFPVVNNPCEFGDRALAAGEISQTLYDNCQAIGMDTTDAGEFGGQWQSTQNYLAPSSPLKPENSDNFTFGFVWDMDVLGGGLVFSTDYWNVEVEDVIDVPNANALFNQCLASEDMSTSAACAVWDPIQYWGVAAGDLLTEYGNLGTLETDGIDFSASFSKDLRNGLGFNAKVDVTYLMSYKSGTNLDSQIEQAGTADGFGVFPEWRATTDLGLAGSSWSADLIFRWLSECDDLWRAPSTTSDAKAEAMLYTDLVGTYIWNQLRITAGINNVFDKDPPYFHSQFNANTEPGLYDVIGRRLFVSATYEF